MINYNIVLFIGLTFYVLIFILFITNEMNKSKLDREQWLSDQLTKSFNKAKNDWDFRNAFCLYPFGTSSAYTSLFYRWNLFYI